MVTTPRERTDLVTSPRADAERKDHRRPVPVSDSTKGSLPIHHWADWGPFVLLVPRDVPFFAEDLKRPDPTNDKGPTLFHKWIMDTIKKAKACGAVGAVVTPHPLRFVRAF
jgi:hypothetical protein